MRLRFAILALLLPLMSAAAGAVEPLAVDFARDIQPILAGRCVSCHGPKKQESGLRLDSGTGLLRGGDNGAAVTPGMPEGSLLLLAVTGKSDVVSKMPAKGEPLTADEIERLRQWIAGGAQVPADTIE